MRVKLLRIILRLFWIFPVKKNKVVLTAYNGRLYTCSPKYIAEGLLKKGNYDILYALRKDSKDTLPYGIKSIQYRSFSHFYHLMTAKFVIFNSGGISGSLPYRKEQIIIQTWHGGYSFKVIGNDFFSDEKSRKNRKLTGSQITYFLSGSKMATEQHSPAMCVAKEKFLNIGLPRNDILFQDNTTIREKVYKQFELNENAKIALYAPTYRDGPVKAMSDYGLEPIDDKAVIKALEDHFGGKYVFMYKAHHDMVPTNIGEECINASEYSDIQELMCAADILITDYSSCMADFALQRRPGFLYTPDLKEYESVHPFSMEPEKWPYQIACSNAELLMNISQYESTAGLAKIEDFFTRIGNCDEGRAVEALLAIMDEKKRG